MKQRRRPSRHLIALVALVLAAASGAAACSDSLGLRADKDRSRQESTDADTTSTAPATTPDGHDPSSAGLPDQPPTGGEDSGGASQLPGFSQGVPADWPSDVPVPDGATNVFSTAQGVPGFDGRNGRAIVMEVEGSPADVSAAYKSSLIAQGWEESPLLGMSGAAMPDGGIILQKDGKTLMAFPTQAEGGRSQMMVMVVDGDLASLLQGAGTGVPPG